MKAKFEAEEMHDWNSAKLYSEKALRAMETDNIYPQEITYWKLDQDKTSEIKMGYENLMTVYDNAKINDPYNLAKAISSLDCWAEQQEENWQTWDIMSCKEEFIKSIHLIYEKIATNNSEEENNLNNKISVKDEATIVTKNKDEIIMQIIYFDFDRAQLSNVSKEKIKLFLKKNKEKINEYLVVGHTDTKGSKKYNLDLSIKRAEVVKNVLIENGIYESKIKILGKGENSLAIYTPDDTKQPGNRRVEIKKTN